jgi:asparagine synthase (glutamine-hydrolysing)
MCGIAGAIGTPFAGDAGAQTVERQLDLLEHRGPDARGVFSRGAGAIGQNRLAVIDLQTGDPPIVNEDETVGAVLNGEIYNFMELRHGLRERGHRLTTQGDTEVLAHWAEELEAPDLARRLDGMFAFAVWDSRRERLVLGRDRLGKKPLYFWMDSGVLVFASEIKAVVCAPRVPSRLDQAALPGYLAFGYVPGGRTFYDGVHGLAPGHVLVRERDGAVRIERYWEPRVPRPGGPARVDLPLGEAATEVRSRMRVAVERRMEADVPVGAFLSGGIDSTAVVALMAQVSPRPVRTFTIGFEEPGGFDERPFARLAAGRFGTEHVELGVRPDPVDLVERLVWHHDQPFGDSSAIPTFLLSELTRRSVTVALCGDGGDELFAGYGRFTAALAAERVHRVLRPLGGRLERAGGGTAHGAARQTRRFLAAAWRGLPDAYLEWVCYIGARWRRALVGSAGDWVLDDHRRVWAASAGASTLDRLLDLNLRTYLLEDLLPKVDRASMAHGLEVRAPLLDRELVEFSLRLPRAARVRGLSRKRVLRAAMQDLVPPEILRRRKRGFTAPVHRWMRGQLRPYLDATLGAPGARVREHLDGAALDAMLAEHQCRTANHGHALWTLLTLEVFLRRQGW